MHCLTWKLTQKNLIQNIQEHTFRTKAVDFIKPAQNIKTATNVEDVIYSDTDIYWKYCEE